MKLLYILEITSPIEEYYPLFETIREQTDKDFVLSVHTKNEVDLSEQLNGVKFYQITNITYFLLPHYLNGNLPMDATNFVVLTKADMLNHKFTKNVKEYITAYPDVAMFLPVTLNFNEVDGKSIFQAFSNELVWAVGATEVQGYLDFNYLKEHPIFTFNCAVYNYETFKSVGGLKQNFVQQREYEFALRLLNKGHNMMTIPKFLCSNTTVPTDIKVNYDERVFWLTMAKKECFFTEDRNIVYEPKTLTVPTTHN